MPGVVEIGLTGCGNAGGSELGGFGGNGFAGIVRGVSGRTGGMVLIGSCVGGSCAHAEDDSPIPNIAATACFHTR